MSADGLKDDDIRTILGDVKVIALVGASPNPDRPSYRVMQYLISRGYRVIPVNPGQAGKVLHGQPVVARLADIGEPVDMIDVFRAADALPGVVEEALAMPHRPKVIWGQLGVSHPEAAEKAGKAGLTMVMDRCPAIEIPRLGL